MIPGCDKSLFPTRCCVRVIYPFLFICFKFSKNSSPPLSLCLPPWLSLGRSGLGMSPCFQNSHSTVRDRSLRVVLSWSPSSSSSSLSSSFPQETEFCGHPEEINACIGNFHSTDFILYILCVSCIHVHTYVCMYVSMCMLVYKCEWVCVCVCVCVYYYRRLRWWFSR